MYSLDPVNVDAEVARIRQALGDIPITLLAATERGTRPTLSRLMDELRAGHHVLYLVCHGVMNEGEPWLWLECDDGKTERVAGETLVAGIRGLSAEQRPRLVILASCQSAGRDEAAAVLAALGPKLAQIGVGAVIGMQGNLPTDVVGKLMPRLFEVLRVDGQIDHALAVARLDLHPDQPWWMPVLYMRLRDGRLWAPSVPPPNVNTVPLVAEGLDALLELLRVPTVREAAAAFQSYFTTVRAQVHDVIALKDLHDQLHTLQFHCYNPLMREAPRFPDDELAIDSIYEYTFTLRARTSDIRDIFARAPIALGANTWVTTLEKAHEKLEQATFNRNPILLRAGLSEIRRVLNLQPSYINANLVAGARNLRLHQLVQAMNVLREQLSSVAADQSRKARFDAGVAALANLEREMHYRIAGHDAWQEIDREMRYISDTLRHGTSDLEAVWPNLKLSITRLAADDTALAAALRNEVVHLDQALVEAEGRRAASVFHRLNQKVGECFFKVDIDLKRLCSQLRELGDPLRELERILA